MTRLQEFIFELYKILYPMKCTSYIYIIYIYIYIYIYICVCVCVCVCEKWWKDSEERNGRIYIWMLRELNHIVIGEIYFELKG